MRIGTFTKNSDGSFVGDVITLSVQAKNVRIVPDDRSAANTGTTHRVMVSGAEIGVGWFGEVNGVARILLELDDPSFVAPIKAVLAEAPESGKFDLVWARNG